jgi:hypothetical protein
MRGVLALGLIAATGCDAVLRLTTVSARDAGVDITVDAVPDAPIVDGLVAHYTFEQVGTPCLADVTGRGHDAICQTSPPSIVTGPPRHDNAFMFDGTQYLTVPYARELDSSLAFSVAVWINVTGYPDLSGGSPIGCMVNRPLLDQGADSWQLCMAPVNGFFSVSDTAAGSAPAMNGTWTHVAMTWDATNIRAYVNGALAGTVMGTVPAFDTQGIWIGADNDGAPGVHFQGALDDLYIYNRTLSAAEIAVLAQ